MASVLIWKKITFKLVSPAAEIKQQSKLREAPGRPPAVQQIRTSSMPRYFFNTRIGQELILDSEGEELRDPDHAWNVARTTIPEILKTDGGQAGLLNAILEVSDDDGEIVLEFPFTEAILDGSEDSGTRH
jgi:hypothetical protein